jgi:ubiquinone biosynthesis protein
MLKPELVPTQLISSGERGRIPIVEPRDQGRYRVLYFLAVTFRWGATVGWTFLRGRLTRQEYAEQFRHLLEELGGLWVKAGQLLSLRVDLFSREFCKELSKLQFRAIGFPTAMARKIIEEDLGAHIEDIFEDFTDTPFATASIGQIYRARLRNEGSWVAIKVQRPYIAISFDRDRQLIRWIVRICGKIPSLRFVAWEEAWWELNQIMDEELDYRYEASSLKRMKKTLKRHNIYVPELFNRYTTKRVLVMEFIHAALMSDFLRLYVEDPPRLSVWLQENNVDPVRVARRLLFSSLRQVLEDNLYHGDLHPGNIILLKDSRVAFIDMGSIGFTETEYLERIRLFIKALAMRDFAKAADLNFMVAGSLPSVELDELKKKVIRVLRAWAGRTHVKELPYAQKSMDSALIEVFQLMNDYRITMEWSLLRMHRAFTTLDSALMILYPEMNYSKLLRDYFEEAERRRVKKLVAGMTMNVVNSVSSFFEIQQHMAEQMFHESAIVRRQAQIFEGETSKWSYIFEVIFGQAVMVQVVLGLLMLIGVGHQYYPAWVQPMGPQIEVLAQLLPTLDFPIWIVLIVLDAYVCISTLRLKRRFARNDNRRGGDRPSW